MKIKLILMALSISPIAMSQNYGQMNYFEYSLQRNNLNQIFFFDQTLNAKTISDNSVSEIEINSEYNKGKAYTIKYSFNKSGNVLNIVSKNSVMQFRYIQDSILKEKTSKWKKKESKTVYEYDPKLTLTSETVFKNGKVTSKRTVEIENGKLIKQTYASGINLKKFTVLEKEFTEEGKLSRTMFYKNGKLKNQWDYSCKPEGSDLIASKSNDLSNYCQYKEESVDGSYKSYTRTIEKGKSYLFVAAYDKDSTFIRQDKFENDSILINSTVVNGNETMMSYYKKGKFKYGYNTTRNVNMQMTRQDIYSGKKKKLTSSNKYSFGKDDLIVLHEYFKNGKLVRKSSYNYISFE